MSSLLLDCKLSVFIFNPSGIFLFAYAILRSIPNNTSDTEAMNAPPTWKTKTLYGILSKLSSYLVPLVISTANTAEVMACWVPFKLCPFDDFLLPSHFAALWPYTLTSILISLSFSLSHPHTHPLTPTPTDTDKTFPSQSFCLLHPFNIFLSIYYSICFSIFLTPYVVPCLTVFLFLSCSLFLSRLLLLLFHPLLSLPLSLTPSITLPVSITSSLTLFPSLYYSICFSLSYSLCYSLPYCLPLSLLLLIEVALSLLLHPILSFSLSYPWFHLQDCLSCKASLPTFRPFSNAPKRTEAIGSSWKTWTFTEDPKCWNIKAM